MCLKPSVPPTQVGELAEIKLLEDNEIVEAIDQAEAQIAHDEAIFGEVVQIQVDEVNRQLWLFRVHLQQCLNCVSCCASPVAVANYVFLRAPFDVEAHIFEPDSTWEEKYISVSICAQQVSTALYDITRTLYTCRHRDHNTHPEHIATQAFRLRELNRPRLRRIRTRQREDTDLDSDDDDTVPPNQRLRLY